MNIRSTWSILLLALVLSSCAGSPGTDNDAGGMNDAAAAQAEADAALADTPVPPGANVAVTIADTSASYQVGYGRSAVEGLAMCAWFRYWLEGIASDDPVQVSAAADASKLFSGWEIYVSADQSFRDVVNGVVDKANLGDAAPMAQFVEVNCASES